MDTAKKYACCEVVVSMSLWRRSRLARTEWVAIIGFVGLCVYMACDPIGRSAANSHAKATQSFIDTRSMQLTNLVSRSDLGLKELSGFAKLRNAHGSQSVVPAALPLRAEAAPTVAAADAEALEIPSDGLVSTEVDIQIQEPSATELPQAQDRPSFFDVPTCSRTDALIGLCN